MKKFTVTVTILLFISTIGLFGSAAGKKIDDHNQYGGITEEETYSQDSDKYRDGLAKIVEFYDGYKRIKKIESYYTDERSKIDGVYKREQYYENDPFERSELKKAEFYYTRQYSDKEGLAKAEHYYDDGKRKKTEFYHTDEHAKKKQVSKIIVDYDGKGEVSKRTFYDKNGKVLSTEEKKKVSKPD